MAPLFGLGLAAVENVLYMVSAADWANVAIIRAILTVPYHGALGAIAGAYIGEGSVRRCARRKHKRPLASPAPPVGRLARSYHTSFFV